MRDAYAYAARARVSSTASLCTHAQGRTLRAHALYACARSASHSCIRTKSRSHELRAHAVRASAHACTRITRKWAALHHMSPSPSHADRFPMHKHT
eukprot:6212662-Pleurochrysis_carterae.AAC.5